MNNIIFEDFTRLYKRWKSGKERKEEIIDDSWSSDGMWKYIESHYRKLNVQYIGCSIIIDIFSNHQFVIPFINVNKEGDYYNIKTIYFDDSDINLDLVKSKLRNEFKFSNIYKKKHYDSKMFIYPKKNNIITNKECILILNTILDNIN